MPDTEPRRYQKIDDTEIDLVIKSRDSHEFYEQYREVFADRKKGIDSISKIWKRRSEFIKKRQDAAAKQELSVPMATSPAAVGGPSCSPELEKLIATQNALLGELSGVMKEQLKVSKGLMALLQKQAHGPEGDTHGHEEAKSSEHKEHEHKPKPEKTVGSIVVGS